MFSFISSMFGPVTAVVAYLSAHGLPPGEILALAALAKDDIAAGKSAEQIGFDLLVKWKADQGK